MRTNARDVSPRNISKSSIPITMNLKVGWPTIIRHWSNRAPTLVDYYLLLWKQKYLFFFLAHIFFDDAFELSDHDENESQVNRFVKLLVGTLDEAASDVHKTRMHVRAPKKYPTPYGGRLVWTLPGKTKMIAHLKDKSKIRHRKRWSQVTPCDVRLEILNFKTKISEFKLV